MLYHTLRDFWRIGYHVDPLHVTLEHQDGSGRFDDPEKKLTVLYGAGDPRTCILPLEAKARSHGCHKRGTVETPGNLTTI